MTVQREKSEEERLESMAVNASGVITGDAGDKLKKFADRMGTISTKKKAPRERPDKKGEKGDDDGEIEF